MPSTINTILIEFNNTDNIKSLATWIDKLFGTDNGLYRYKDNQIFLIDIIYSVKYTNNQITLTASPEEAKYDVIEEYTINTSNIKSLEMLDMSWMYNRDRYNEELI